MEASDEDEEDDDFDDFNEANDDGDSDFGSFDDVSFENDLLQLQPEPAATDQAAFDEQVLEDPQLFQERLELVLDTIFPQATAKEDHASSSNAFLSDRSLEIFTELATLPHLKPPNWKKLKIRHNLLIKLGIPINLDEISDDKHDTDKRSHLEIKHTHQRKKSINADDINWDGFDIPEFESLKLTGEEKVNLLNSTSQTLSRIERDNLNNSTRQYLESSSSDDALDSKLKQFQANYDELLTLSSIWNGHLKDLRNNFDIYESVVQNFIGYSQKLRREEILENLKKVKHKGKKSKRLW
ncbi:uncharacterized protein CANTADRAFT_70284 [Suhomyces tanzawaensis NRRL Y-17324]|uniref:Uncharacterized protein n=1 Tax=Suhomyces tanzawaensis NRRL Y-17324 TaxID=984487 RepID=A0A1E4SCQ9_9ASCO|nr:uncharacterized protein CANTADRAFT_70284 [Suhomyces tanzawaensis NRRL Y-17324]ODV77301.1 hypothetical protein CANTADRAFT_70284 [Suhomyces tanzawaensis NRRL Y-17324]